MSFSPTSSLVFNEVRFDRMACGDHTGFHELADEYFADIRARLGQWEAMRESGEFRRMSEEFHRCKGGAAMFGFEKLYVLLGQWELEARVDKGEVDFERLAEEVTAAEEAVQIFRTKQSDG